MLNMYFALRFFSVIIIQVNGAMGLQKRCTDLEVFSDPKLKIVSTVA